MEEENLDKELEIIKKQLPFQFEAKYFLAFNPEKLDTFKNGDMIIFDYEENKLSNSNIEFKLNNWKLDLHPLILSLKFNFNNDNDIKEILKNLKYIILNKTVYDNSKNKDFISILKKILNSNKKYDNSTDFKFINEYNKIRLELLIPNIKHEINSNHLEIVEEPIITELDFVYFINITNIDNLDIMDIINNIKNINFKTNNVLCFNDNFLFYKNEYLNNKFENSLRYCTYGNNIQYYSPHFGLIKKVESEHFYRVKGDYKYYHYHMENESDSGWGCAYRSLQTLISFLIYNNKNINKFAKIPSIRKIQETLVEIGDKNKKFIGSSEWIGSFEVGYVVSKLCGNEFNIIHLSNGDQISQYYKQIKEHFENNGSPIMIGGGSKAFTILGILYFGEEQEDKTQFLILDPHYEGNVNIDKYIDSKRNTIYFKNKSFFKSVNFYNLCLIN